MIKKFIGGLYYGKKERKLQGCPMTKDKKSIISLLLQEYNIKSAGDIQDALKNLLGGTIQEML